MINQGVILAHAGKQHSYHVAKALKELGLLRRFYTSSYVKSKRLQDYLTKSGNLYWTRRFTPGIDGKIVNSSWLLELPEVTWRAIEGKSPRVQRAIYNRDIRFDYRISDLIKNEKNSSIFWGFQGSCHETLKVAKSIGMEAWCELSTAHVIHATRILGEEAKLQPYWASTIDNLIFPPFYQKRLEEEPHLATKVIAASGFTRQSLIEAGIREEKIITLPLGCDTSHVPFNIDKWRRLENRPLKLLYAGTITQRKGISYLLEAARMLSSDIKAKQLEIHLIGGVQGNPELVKPYGDIVELHPPVSQQTLFARYGEYDALILPTIFEGFGLVIIEAMAAGLPVITTPNSIGPELIKDGENGYIIPIRDSKAICEAIDKLRSLTSDKFLEMKLNAREIALLYSWDGYTKRLKNILSHFKSDLT